MRKRAIPQLRLERFLEGGRQKVDANFAFVRHVPSDVWGEHRIS
jgi:hypothetical protein